MPKQSRVIYANDARHYCAAAPSCLSLNRLPFVCLSLMWLSVWGAGVVGDWWLGRRPCTWGGGLESSDLFAMEPPMTLEDAWRPIDDVAGTNVDTFVYMVERGDGLFCELHRPIIPPHRS